MDLTPSPCIRAKVCTYRLSVVGDKVTWFEARTGHLLKTDAVGVAAIRASTEKMVGAGRRLAGGFYTTAPSPLVGSKEMATPTEAEGDEAALRRPHPIHTSCVFATLLAQFLTHIGFDLSLLLIYRSPP